MSDGYHVSPPAVVRLADGFTGQQQSFARLGSPVQRSAAAVDTGEAALDQETRALIDTINSLFGLFAQGMERTGAVLAEIAEDYEADDRGTADVMDRISAEDLGGATVPQV
jgi:hypothetical protein